MRKIVYLGLIITVVITMSFLLFNNDTQGIVDEKISSSLANALATRSNDARLHMSDVNANAWDKLHIYPPYTSKAILEKDFPSLPSSVTSLGIQSRDDVNLLIFSTGSTIQSAAVISRGMADFNLAGHPMVVDRKAAEFVVQVQGGRTVLILRP